MFYLLFSLVFVALIGAYVFCKYKFKNNSNKFNNLVQKVLKIITIVFCAFTMINILLPDGFVISLSPENILGINKTAFAFLRWFACVPFVVYPIAVFFNNRTFKNIAIYFCVPITIISICCFTTYLEGFTSVAGRGLNSIDIFSDGFKAFLVNPTFRSITIGAFWLLQLIIPVVLMIQEKHVFNVKSKKEWLNFAIVLPLIIISVIPIFVPQYIIGYTNIIFDQYTIPQLIWFIVVIAEVISLYFIFRKKSEQDKFILCLVLALCLLLQYNQMFGAISISVKRLPFQLCNIGSYLVLASLLTKNKKIFDFTVIVNVVGVVLAMAFPDLDGKGIGYLYNIHFIVEHTNVLIVPMLALMLGLFDRLNKKSLKHFFFGFLIYFCVVLVLGTLFNAIALGTGNSFYSANYLFMFDQGVADEALGVGGLFNTVIKIGNAVFYPVIQILVYVVFNAICFACFGIIQLIYKINDIKKKKVLINK